ncbi:restriction endonuclease subunit S [Salmonella enterica subsp. houtenae serovar 50:g,z51:-]|nr:restriction endonuclease subunit S [Salmonella enterica subsp. houtenae serovar 50:g,z51:-]
MSGGKLPEGWVTTHLSEICSKPQYGYTTKSSSMGDVKFLRTTDITKGAVDWSSVPYCMDAPEDVSKYQLQDRDIVISRAGSVGFSFLVQNPPSQVVFASYLIRFKPVNYFSEYYLKRFLESSDYWNQLSLMSAGNAVQNVNAQKLSTLTVPIAPIAEQKIIAEKLDTLLAQVDSTKARLEQIPKILKRFRQAVLATAMSGKLTNLPTANYLKIKDIACVIGGLTKNSKRNNFELKVPYLRVANVYENELKLDDVAEIGVQPNELRRVSLEYEDLLIVEGNGSLDQIGRAALWRKEIQECVHQNHLIKVRANKAVLYPTFLLFYLMSPQGKEEIVNRATSGAGLYTLSISKISSINVPVYSLPEQHQIVRRVEQLFAYADTIEKQVNNALTRVNSLTQSILAKAFRGELTAQWRAENPSLISGENSAAALLEKIKAERAASGGKKTSRKRA